MDQPRRAKWLPGALLLLGGVALLAGFVYDVLFAGIPYQDPTAELAARYAFHSGVAATIRATGGVLLGAGMLTLIVQVILSKVKRR